MDSIISSKQSVSGYREIIEVTVPVRFYWTDDGFDGIEFGPFPRELFPWEMELINRCLECFVDEEE